MTPLADEALRILEAEAAYPPLTVESMVKVLHAIGFAEGRLEESVVEAALVELMQAGQVEAVHSSRLGRRFRAMRQPAAVVAAAGNTT